MQSFDITIVGGGMVGLALAASFAESNLRIAVIEGQTPDESLNACARYTSFCFESR